MNELMTLIDLYPGIRLPQHEEEIFSDKELTEYYLRELCGQYAWYDHDDSVSCMAYSYASEVMGSHWPEAEHVIATNTKWAYFYAKYVMKSRWYEAEHIIATNPIWACNYAIYVMDSRWPEAEAFIATDPEWAYYYATDVIKSRWYEAEAVIATDREYRERYNEEFGTNI